MKPTSSRKTLNLYAVLAVLIAFNVIALFASISIGRFGIPLGEVAKTFLARFFKSVAVEDPAYSTVIFSIRLPRIVAAMLIGAALSQSGAAYQGLFNNPLVDPYILGISAGAGLGASIAILLGGNHLVIQLSAFAFSIVAVLITVFAARSSRSNIALVLSGFIVSSLFSSIISFLKYYADPYTKLPSIVFWLMGSLSQISMNDLLYIIPFVLLAILLLFLLRWKLNILSLGQEEAITLGENPARLKLSIIIISSLLTSLCVSLSGIIGWVGLVIPHLGRMLVGPDYRKLLPVSLFLGSLYLVVMDTLSRSLAASEIPIGILTAFVGAPFFIFLMRRTGYKWG